MRAPLERLSIRAVLAIGLVVTLGLWVFTGYTFARRMAVVERQAADIAARYTRAQELLSTVRAQVLLGAIHVRDALLNPDSSSVGDYRRAIDETYQSVVIALARYEPVFGSSIEEEQIERMRREVDELHRTSLGVLDGVSSQSLASVRDLLNSRIIPRREAAVRISEEIQTLNRTAFIRQQTEMAEIYRVAERQSWWRLGLALAVSAAVGLVAAFYAGRLESRLRRQMDRETRISTELQDVASRLMSAQEDERRTIARELHDEVGQVLTAIKVELALAQRSLESRGAPVEPLAEAQLITDGAIQSVRDLTQLLRPAVLDDLGLPAAIDQSLRGLARRHDIRVELRQTGMNDRLDPETEVAAYRIVQEALTNVARHAAATRCSVHLRRQVQRLTLEVEDDGRGFEPSRTDDDGLRRGLGLIGIRERATHLGGTVDIYSAPGRGTRMIVDLPAGVASV